VTYPRSASQSIYLLNTPHATIPSIIYNGYIFGLLFEPHQIMRHLELNKNLTITLM